MELRRTQLDTSVLQIENFVSNPSRIPFPDGLETELSVSNFDFSCSICFVPIHYTIDLESISPSMVYDDFDSMFVSMYCYYE